MIYYWKCTHSMLLYLLFWIWAQPLVLLIIRFCLKGCSTTSAFPEYLSDGLTHTCLIEFKGLQFRERYLGSLISIVAFPKVPVWAHCSTSSMIQSCSISLSDIFLTCTATPKILGFVKAGPRPTARDGPVTQCAQCPQKTRLLWYSG